MVSQYKSSLQGGSIYLEPSANFSLVRTKRFGRVVSVDPQVGSLDGKMPSAIGLDIGTEIVVINVSDTIEFDLNDNASSLLSIIATKKVSLCYLADNSTVAGQWVVILKDLNVFVPLLTGTEMTLLVREVSGEQDWVDYPVTIVNIDTASKVATQGMEADGSDIEFRLADGTILDFEIVSGMNTVSTEFVVEVSLVRMEWELVYMFSGDFILGSGGPTISGPHSQPATHQPKIVIVDFNNAIDPKSRWVATSGLHFLDRVLNNSILSIASQGGLIARPVVQNLRGSMPSLIDPPVLSSPELTILRLGLKGWTPAQIPELIAAWWIYDRGRSIRFDSPDTFLTDWADQGPGGHDLEQTTDAEQPKVNATAIEFDGTDDGMTVPSDADFGLAGGIAIFTILDTNQISSNKVLISKWISGSNGEWVLFTRHFAGGNACSFIIRNSAGTVSYIVEAEQINDGSLHLVQAIFDLSDVKLRIDDNTEVTASAADFRALQSAPVWMGKYGTAAGFSQMNEREALILKAPPDAELLANIRTYFQARLDEMQPIFQTDGSIFATSFDDGPTGQVLTSDLDVGAFVGRRGDTTGPDGADPAWVTEGAEFDGGDRFTNVGSPPSGDVDDFRFIQDDGVFTIYLSFNADDVGDTLQTIFDNKDSSVSNPGCGCLWNKSTGVFVFAVVFGSSFYTVSVSAASGSWHGIVIVGDGVDCKLYLNGSDVASPDSEVSITIESATASHNVLRIARGSGTSLNRFDGKMGYCTIHDTTHDEATITTQREFLTALMDGRGVTMDA